MPEASLPTTSATADQDRRRMRQALELAMRIPVRPWPNPPVGAVVVRDGEVVGQGAHHGAGEAHAERVALAAAGQNARGATLYCTLEPCRHQGRTPPCTEAILAAGIARVVVGMRDLNPAAAGGADVLRTAGVTVTAGVLARECLDLVWPFVCTDQFRRPYVELKTATSLDGFFTGPDDPAGHPVYLTGEAARRDVHRRRRWLDLVLVGQGTARQDQPRLDTRLLDADAACPAAEPLAGCVAGRQGSAALSRDRWLLFHADPSRDSWPAGAEAVACPAADGGVDPAGVVGACAARGLSTIMLEGGPRLAASFLAAGLVDRWVQYTAPRTVGSGVGWPATIPAAPACFHLTSCEPVGDDLRTIWDRRDFTAALAQVGGDQEVLPCSPA